METNFWGVPSGMLTGRSKSVGPIASSTPTFPRTNDVPGRRALGAARK